MIEGGQPFKLRFPLPKDDMRGIPEAVEAIALSMQQTYMVNLSHMLP